MISDPNYAWSCGDSEYRYYEVCESTNDLAMAWLKDVDHPACEGSVVSAGYQTKGRGRRGKSWTAGFQENLLLSIILKPPYKPEYFWKVAYVAGIAIADTLSSEGIDAALKWPNDVLINWKKTAGVLIEAAQYTANGEQKYGIIVGIGLNINQTDFGDPAGYAYLPASMKSETNIAYDINNIRIKLCNKFSYWEKQHRDEYDTPEKSIIDNWRRYMSKDAVIRRGDTLGYLVDIETDGSALIRLQNGTLTHWRTVEG